MSTISASGCASAEAQLWLFDTGIDLGGAREAVEDLMSATQAENTVKAYAHSWRVFCSWCTDAGRQSLPADPDTVRLFIGWCLKDRAYRLETVRTHLSSIKSHHRRKRLPSPFDDSVRSLLRSAARRLRERPAGAQALTPDQLRKVSCALLQDGRPVAVRDRAVILVGFCGAMRRCELSGLQVEDVDFVKKGLRLSLWKTKTDQQGLGRQVGIHPAQSEDTCPVRAVRAWLKLRGDGSGPLFRRVYSSGRIAEVGGLSGEAINEALKRSLALAGIDSKRLSAHSWRKGFVTSAAEGGASHLQIMRTTGHKSVHMVLRYFKPVEAFAVNPLAGVL